MNFIKRVFEGKSDDYAHLQFQRFSRGEFKNRALIRIKNSGGKFTINTSSEFANELVRIVAEKLGDKITLVTGGIISTNDLTGEIDFKEKKQFQGVKKYVIEKEMSGKDILNLLNKFPRTFFALSFNVDKDNTSLKIKPKAPKSGKPGTKGEDAPKADFCKLVTEDHNLAKSFVVEKPDFKEAEINHCFIINEMVIPDELKKSNDFAKIREEAKRKGKIIRNAIIDGKEIKTEKDFVA